MSVLFSFLIHAYITTYKIFSFRLVTSIKRNLSFMYNEYVLQIHINSLRKSVNHEF